MDDKQMDSCFCGLGWYYGIVKVPVAVKNELCGYICDSTSTQLLAFLCGYVIQRTAGLAFWFAKLNFDFPSVGEAKRETEMWICDSKNSWFGVLVCDMDIDFPFAGEAKGETESVYSNRMLALGR
uniref:Uncharacterized protein n=1 Tax=Solanum lycopersicum TaxID=4081 RepID=A0A3Q7IQJ9_SOLLC